MQGKQEKATVSTQNPSLSENLVDLVTQGKAALEKGNLEEALLRFEEVVRYFPDRPEGHNNLGALYASLGKPDQAETCFSKVLALLPGNPNIHYNRGLMRARQEKFAAATLDFEIALEHNPQDPDVHNNLGVAAFLAGDAERARVHFEASLEAKHDHLGAFINLCDLDEATDHTPQAVSRCRDFLAMKNDYLVRRRLLGLLLVQGTKDLTAAKDEAHALLAVQPQDLDIQKELTKLDMALPHLKHK